MTASTEHITNDTILTGIVCNQCKETLPPHSAKIHLEDPTNSIFKCPHNINMTIPEIVAFILANTTGHEECIAEMLEQAHSDNDSDSENSVYEPLENFKGTICRLCGDDIDWQNEDFFVEHPTDKTQILCGDCGSTCSTNYEKTSIHCE